MTRSLPFEFPHQHSVIVPRAATDPDKYTLLRQTNDRELEDYLNTLGNVFGQFSAALAPLNRRYAWHDLTDTAPYGTPFNGPGATYPLNPHFEAAKVFTGLNASTQYFVDVTAHADFILNPPVYPDDYEAGYLATPGSQTRGGTWHHAVTFATIPGSAIPSMGFSVAATPSTGGVSGPFTSTLSRRTSVPLGTTTLQVSYGWYWVHGGTLRSGLSPFAPSDILHQNAADVVANASMNAVVTY